MNLAGFYITRTDVFASYYILVTSELWLAFTRFDFSNSYIWFEFYNAPLSKDISLICDVSGLF